MKFFVRLLSFFGVNIILMLLMIGVNPWQYPYPYPLFLAIAISVSATAIVSYQLYKMNEKQIWYFPLSQIIMCFVVCAYLLARNWLGLRRGGGWIDFGVGYDVMLVMLLAALWVVPSSIAALLFAFLIHSKKRLRGHN